MYFYCYVCVWLCIFIVPAGTLRLPWLRFFGAFPSAVRQMPGYNSQRRGTTRTLPKFCVVICTVCFVAFCALFVCKCVLYYCHRVASQSQFNKYIITYIIPISNVSMCYRLIYWKEIAAKFTINKSRKNDERHLPSRSTTQNLCHLKRTLPIKLPIPCHIATNGAHIRRMQILTSPSMGRLTVYRPAGVLPRCPWKNFLVLRPVKMREEYCRDLK